MAEAAEEPGAGEAAETAAGGSAAAGVAARVPALNGILLIQRRQNASRIDHSPPERTRAAQ
jgi:hypothetical protein